jgi:hypothetical protein
VLIAAASASSTSDRVSNYVVGVTKMVVKIIAVAIKKLM